MGRVADPAHRAELLERVAAYAYKNGIADLSLRPLARAVGSSPRVLLYYFSSKQELVLEILSRARARQQAVFERLRSADGASPLESCRAIWAEMSAAKALPGFRLFFEVYGMALRNRRRFAGFLAHAVEDWLVFLEAPFARDGCSRGEARARATIILAGFRGFLLDLCATNDRARVGRAVELWLDALVARLKPAAKAIG